MNIFTGLAHGTSERRLPSILEGGLEPRYNKTAMWSKYVASDAVYLTDALGMFYAAHAALEDDCSNACLVEVDSVRLDKTRFYADEAYIINTVEAAGWRTQKAFFGNRSTNSKLSMLWDLREELGDKFSAVASLDHEGSLQHVGPIEPPQLRQVMLLRDIHHPRWSSILRPIRGLSHWLSYKSKYRQLQLFALGHPSDEGLLYDHFGAKKLDWVRDNTSRVYVGTFDNVVNLQHARDRLR